MEIIMDANNVVNQVKTSVSAASNAANDAVQQNGNFVVQLWKSYWWVLVGGVVLLAVARFGLHVV